MKNVQYILIITAVLTPMIILLYRLDKKIRPLLTNFRHDLLYLSCAGLTIMLYLILVGQIAKALSVNHFVAATVYSITMILGMLTTLCVFMTLVWWTIFGVKYLVTKEKHNR